MRCLTYRAGKYRLFLRFIPAKVARYATLAHNDDTVALADQFGQFRGHNDHTLIIGCQVTQDGVNLGLGTDIYATRGFVQQQNGWFCRQPPG